MTYRSPTIILFRWLCTVDVHSCLFFLGAVSREKCFYTVDILWWFCNLLLQCRAVLFTWSFRLLMCDCQRWKERKTHGWLLSYFCCQLQGNNVVLGSAAWKTHVMLWPTHNQLFKFMGRFVIDPCCCQWIVASTLSIEFLFLKVSVCLYKNALKSPSISYPSHQ